MCRHQYLGTAGSLGSARQGAVVHGSHLIGMVGEVGGRASVVERELSANEQRALVM